MPSEQLLTKQVIGDGLNVVGQTISVRFNLQRGKIARIWGFRYDISIILAGNIEYTMFVRKTSNAVRQLTPKDNLWLTIRSFIQNGTGFFLNSVGDQVMFPKPHRTTGLTVQMHCSAPSSSRGVLIIYYDIDDIEKGELVQTWEKNISKGRTRRTISP